MRSRFSFAASALVCATTVFTAGCSVTHAARSTTGHAHSDQVTTRTSVTPAVAAGAGKFAGRWLVHDEQMVINADGTGTLIANAGPCSNPFSKSGSTDMCDDHATFTGGVSPDGRVFTATIAKVWRTDRTTGQTATGQGPLSWHVGERFSDRLVDPKHLLGNGNPYWCAPEAYDRRCGA